MKIFRLNIVIIVCSSLISGFSKAQELNPGNTEIMTQDENVELGPLAKELVEYYGHRPEPVGGMNPAGIHSPPLQPHHLTPKYLDAWVQLLNKLIEEPSPEILFMRNNILNSFMKMSDPESISYLKEAFEKALSLSEDLECNNRINILIKILGALVVIPTEESLDVMLVSLNKAEATYEKNIASDNIKDFKLRDKIYEMMVQPDNPGESRSQKNRLQNVVYKWRDVIREYEKESLSEKNRDFLDKVMAFERAGMDE